MSIIAEGIDQILERLTVKDETPADLWGSWSHPEEFAKSKAVASVPAVAKTLAIDEAIAIAEAQLLTATGEDQLALEARLRNLCRDLTDRAIDTLPDQGQRDVYEGDEDGTGVINIPVASDDRRAARVRFALDNNLHDYGNLSVDEFAPAYAKGGPMWLYSGNRDGVMQMPYAVRVKLVEDVELDSVAAAQEMGRDILKNLDAGDPPA